MLPRWAGGFGDGSGIGMGTGAGADSAKASPSGGGAGSPDLPRATDATFADIYQVEVTSSAEVDFRLNSSAFDAYLILLDAKGNLVDQDDDSGGGTDARVNLLLAPGTYYVVAKPSSDYTAGGAYTLSVQQTLE